ncbi:predicted protein [Uncinocarpus reesii 1704]|uniref:Uncharacterized protein n=1 Tax=Uncinocarpus reesii (strain UAMH 1704) TaxID=336963 RepID=C4JTU0_UNCRE|nr:uncharacterized protein UREG_05879 [Uncinocarpus reesii 1704]EEP81037.1 predicted protein [Uncinocarpus reesii 1704]
MIPYAEESQPYLRHPTKRRPFFHSSNQAGVAPFQDVGNCRPTAQTYASQAIKNAQGHWDGNLNKFSISKGAALCWQPNKAGYPQ